jgi:hypothetical protein
VSKQLHQGVVLVTNVDETVFIEDAAYSQGHFDYTTCKDPWRAMNFSYHFARQVRYPERYNFLSHLLQLLPDFHAVAGVRTWQHLDVCEDGQ